MAQGQHGWYSSEEKINYIEEYFNSGLSLTDYCKNIDLKRSTLATWIRISRIQKRDFLSFSLLGIFYGYKKK